MEGISGDFSTMKPRLLNLRLSYLADEIQLPQHVLRGHLAGPQRGRLRQIEEHGGEHVALVLERYAADQVRRVLALGEPARRFGGGAMLREDVHRGAVDAPVANRIRVDGDEQIRLARTGAAHAIAQRHEIIAVARQHRPHAGLRIDPPLERTGDGEHYVLFTRAVLADGAGILTAVARVDRNEEIARIRPRMLHLDGRLDRALLGRLPVHRRWDIARRRLRAARGKLDTPADEVHHQPISRAAARAGAHALRPHRARQIEHDALAGCAVRHAHLFDHAGSRRGPARIGREPRAGQIDDDAVGIGERRDAVGGARREIHHHARPLETRRKPDGADLDGSGRTISSGATSNATRPEQGNLMGGKVTHK